MTGFRMAIAMGAALTLAACGPAVPPPKSAPPAPVRYAPNPYLGASNQAPADIVGRDARALQQLFGAPRLDVREGAGRKLQFANDRCVLDTFLYAPRNGAEAVVTYAEARTRAGVDMPASACVSQLRPH